MSKPRLGAPELLMEARFNELLMAKSCEERLFMGCSMFDAAKQIVKDSLCAGTERLTGQKLKEGIFLRFYGNEFNLAQKKKILAVIGHGQE